MVRKKSSFLILGTMNRAAMAGAALAKERKELRQQLDSDANKDMSKPWLETSEKRESEWKKKMFNNATTFGKITSLSMKEQRESLPIFKLRSTIVKAVEENVVLVVVGDTGSGKVCDFFDFILLLSLLDDSNDSVFG